MQLKEGGGTELGVETDPATPTQEQTPADSTAPGGGSNEQATPTPTAPETADSGTKETAANPVEGVGSGEQSLEVKGQAQEADS